MNDDEHDWILERVETFLAGGLTDVERARFETHIAQCDSCTANVAATRKLDDSLQSLFSSARPASEFEDRLVSGLRTHRRWWALPAMVRRAATAMAAVLILGATGFIVSHVQDHGQLPSVALDSRRIRDASDLRQITEALADYANDSTELPRTSWADSTPAQRSPNEMAQTTNEVAEAQIRGALFGSERSGVVPADATLSLGGASFNLEGNGRGRLAGQDRYLESTNGPVATEGEKSKIQGGQGGGGGVNVLGGDGHAEFGVTPLASAADVDGDATALYYRYADNTPAKPNTNWFRPGEWALAQPAAPDGQAAAEPAVPGERVEGGVKGNLQQQGQQPGVAGKVDADFAVDGPATTPPPIPAAPADRKIIRNGELEFEVDSFDSSFVNIARIVAEEGGFIGTTNSEKLPNGKVKGVIAVRVPPDRLDVLVIKLRALGELKSQKITALDVTKEFVDSESELRAARAMEERLLEIIKSGKGEIKELLAAEKELSVWRSKIEKIEGELRYLASQVSLSTLTISLYEKDLKTPTAAFEQETANIGVETVDVETARADALKAIDDAKGRVIESDLKKHDAGQLAARIVAEVSPETSGGVIDRLKQLGKVARLEIERKQTTAGGTGTPTPGVRVEKRDTRLVISLYNLANVAPRETVSLNIAAKDVESAYRAVLASVEKAGGRVVTSNLNRAKADQTTGSVNFEVPAAQGGAVEAEVRIVGDVMRLTVTENPDTENVTRAKRGYAVQLYSLAQVAPRETIVLQLASDDVAAACQAMLNAAQSSEARVLVSKLDQQDRENVTAHLDFEVTREKLEALTSARSKAGEVYSQNVNRSSDTENTVDSKVRLQMTFINVNRLAPRETTTMGVEANNVEKTMGDVLAQATGAGGRIVTSNLSKESSGRSSAKVIVDVPLAEAQRLITSIRDAGIVRMIQSSRNTQVPDGKLARARIDLTLANADLIVAQDDGFWSAIKTGLSKSITGLLWSLQLIVIGLCFVGPWIVILWLIWRYVMRRKATA